MALNESMKFAENDFIEISILRNFKFPNESQICNRISTITIGNNKSTSLLIA